MIKSYLLDVINVASVLVGKTFVEGNGIIALQEKINKIHSFIQGYDLNEKNLDFKYKIIKFGDCKCQMNVSQRLIVP